MSSHRHFVFLPTQLRIKKKITRYHTFAIKKKTVGTYTIISGSKNYIVGKSKNAYKNKAHSGNNMKRLCRHLPLTQFMNELLSQE